jgi:hypothetical protein
MGEKRDTFSLMVTFLRKISGEVSSRAPTGAKVLAATLAPRETKKDRNIHRATEARADVAMLLKAMEKRMEMPSQKEM